MQTSFFPANTLVTAIVAASVTALVACSWAHQPSPADDVELQWEVDDPTRTPPKAELFLTDEGLWGYEPTDEDDFQPEMPAGRLVELSTDDRTHTFGVVEADEWGYRLQRLDDRRLDSEISGNLRSVDTTDLDEDDDYCLVSSPDSLADDCPLSHNHRRWHLYEIDDLAGDSDIDLIGRYTDFEESLGFPVQRDGLAGGDNTDHWVEHRDDAEGPFVAVAARPGPSTTVRPTIVHDTDCSVATTDSALVESLRRPFDETEAPLEEDAHPLTVEAAAHQLGADAMVGCAETPRLFVPMLTRPLLTEADARYLGPPSLGLTPRPLGDDPADVTTTWPTAAALVAAGDPSAASFWIERGLAEAGDDEELLRLALASMPTVAVGNRPELALRIGTRIGDDFWHPENDPDYLDGLIAILDLLGETDELRDHLEHRDSLVTSHHRHRAGWYRWAHVRHQLAQRRASHGPAFQETIDDLQDRDLDGWALAVWLTLRLEDLTLPIVDDPADLQPRFAEFGAGDLWASLLDDESTARCPPDSDAGGGETCTPTSYGWRASTHKADPVARLRGLPSIQYDGDFDLSGATAARSTVDSPAHELRYWLAVSPLVSSTDLGVVSQSTTTTLREQFDTDPTVVCSELAGWRARFSDAAARQNAPIVDDRQRDWVELLHWWADDGLEALCAGPARFLAAIEDQRNPGPQWFSTTLELLEARLLGADQTYSDLSLMKRAVEIADRLGDDELCGRWSLGLALGAIRAGQFEAADDLLVEATGCLPDDSPLVEARKFVSAYLDFERSAGRPVVTDGGVDQALQSATRRRLDEAGGCAGLAAIGFRFDRRLPASVIRIADQIDVQPAPHDAFGLQTASSVVADGRAAYLAGVRDLQRGAPRPAARALLEAARQFEHVDHLPGIGRVALIDDVIYEGRLTDWADEDDPPDSPAGDHLEVVDDGRAHQLTDQAPSSWAGLDDGDIARLTVGLLIDRRDEEIEPHLSDPTRLPERFCNPETDGYTSTVEPDQLPIIDDSDAPDS